MVGTQVDVKKLEALKKQISTCAKNADALIALNKKPAGAKKAGAKKAGAGKGKKAGAKKAGKKGK